MFFVLGFLCSGPDQVIFQRHKKNETERAAKGEGGTRLSGLASGIFSRIARTTPNDAAYPALTCRRVPQFRRQASASLYSSAGSPLLWWL